MTGMEVEWHYNGTVTPDVKYLDHNKNFIRIVNILHYLGINQTARLWEEVRRVRFNWMMERGVDRVVDDTLHSFYANILQVKPAVTSDHLTEIEESLKMELEVPTVPISEEVTDQVLTEAGEMYIYLIDYPDARLRVWIEIYSDLIKDPKSDLRQILLRVADIAANTEESQAARMAQRMLMRWSDILSLTNINIQTLMVAPAGNNDSVPETIRKGGINFHD